MQFQVMLQGPSNKKCTILAQRQRRESVEQSAGTKTKAWVHGAEHSAQL